MENKQNIGLELFEAQVFWSHHRWFFNLIMFFVGIGSVLIFSGMYLRTFDFLGMVIWAIVANGFYSTSYALDSFIITATKGKKSLCTGRSFLFWIGTLVYVVISVLYACLYFVGPFVQH